MLFWGGFGWFLHSFCVDSADWRDSIYSHLAQSMRAEERSMAGSFNPLIFQSWKVFSWKSMWTRPCTQHEKVSLCVFCLLFKKVPLSLRRNWFFRGCGPQRQPGSHGSWLECRLFWFAQGGVGVEKVRFCSFGVVSFGNLPKEWTTRLVKELLGKHPLGKMRFLFSTLILFEWRDLPQE